MTNGFRGKKSRDGGRAAWRSRDAVRKSMRQVCVAVGSATINPDLLTAAERIQYEGYLRREDINAAVLKPVETGVSIKEIVRSPDIAGALCAGC
jgi:hypothetical protein